MCPYPDGSTASDAALSRADKAASYAYGLAEMQLCAIREAIAAIANSAANEFQAAVGAIVPELWPEEPQWTLAELIDDTLADYLVALPNPDRAAEDARRDAAWAGADERDDE